MHCPNLGPSFGQSPSFGPNPGLGPTFGQVAHKSDKDYLNLIVVFSKL